MHAKKIQCKAYNSVLSGGGLETVNEKNILETSSTGSVITDDVSQDLLSGPKGPEFEVKPAVWRTTNKLPLARAADEYNVYSDIYSV